MVQAHQRAGLPQLRGILQTHLGPPVMTDPTRIQRERTKGWKMPPNTVYVGRPTLWGNPFVHDDPKVAVEAYERLISGQNCTFEMGPGKLRLPARNGNPDALYWGWSVWAAASIHELRGKNLACFCPIDQPCHADILLKLANAK
jgi:Domain of unknown function (DUF4326)